MNYGLVNSWTSADGVECFDIGELVTTFPRSREDVLRLRDGSGTFSCRDRS
jgi:hypothetical protein